MPIASQRGEYLIKIKDTLWGLENGSGQGGACCFLEQEKEVEPLILRGVPSLSFCLFRLSVGIASPLWKRGSEKEL